MVPELPTWLATTIIIVVTIAFAINFGAQFMPGSTYSPDPAIYGVFMGIVGAAFGLSKVKRDKGDGS